MPRTPQRLGPDLPANSIAPPLPPLPPHRYPLCNSRWAAAEGGKVWCEDPKKVPRKVAPKAVHGAAIRQEGADAAKQPGPAGGEDGAEPVRDALEV